MWLLLDCALVSQSPVWLLIWQSALSSGQVSAWCWVPILVLVGLAGFLLAWGLCAVGARAERGGYTDDD